MIQSDRTAENAVGKAAQNTATHGTELRRTGATRRFAAILLAKQASFWSRALGRGGGEALPGLLAERVAPQILGQLAGRLPHGSVVVTGTNGKTTSSLAISFILEGAGLRVLRNRGGSNLSRGLVSALVQSSRVTRPYPGEDIGLFEVDEATMPQVMQQVTPRVILVTNLFRDQLDRYGEIDKTAALIREGIAAAPDATLVLNADDPAVAALGLDRSRTLYFGLESEEVSARSELAIDSSDCPRCGHALTFHRRYFSHIGLFLCPACGFSRPPCQVCAQSVSLGPNGLSATISYRGRGEQLETSLSGLYNLYNMLAALAVAQALDIPAPTALRGLAAMRPAFGRLERFSRNGRQGVIHLVKNPTGFNQVIENVSAWQKRPVALVCLNDNLADGTDISWIWDVDFRPLVTAFPVLVLSGIRARELEVRLKYAGAGSEQTVVEADLGRALDQALELAAPGESLDILTTYTAMLDLRARLVRSGELREYWRGEAIS
ncbi:MAG: DUF1727 domain-containing protein [Gaiellales bacterium]|nr:DUF1727 domain-containing protein [Gaiellales bacterium]